MNDNIVPKKKFNYIGVPAVFALEMALRMICEAFNVYEDGGGCYIVGSCLENPDWRDVDVRVIMSDDIFSVHFPHSKTHWEHDAKWLFLTTLISEWLSKQTGLPVDFQFQPQTHANAIHKGRREAAGFRIA